MKTNIPTVHQLRKQGWKVKVGHHRRLFRYNPETGKKKTVTVVLKEWEEQYPDFFLDARGGFTQVTITVPNYESDLVGISECSEKELYSKKVGLKKALARALSFWYNEQKNNSVVISE